MKYSDILSKAKQIKTSVEKEYKLPFSTPVYYICKAILKPKTEIPSVKVEMASKSTGDYISNQIYKTTYLGMAERLTKYVETNGKLPNYITAIVSDKTYKIKVSDYVYMFSRILIYYDTNGKLPSYANVTSKSFTKPTETGNTVFDYWVKKFGFKPTCIDDVCDYIRDHFTYEFYFDDKKSNREVIDSKAGNCTDLAQMTVNMGIAMGYQWEAIHTQCRQSGTGHIYPRFRKTGEWFTRDVACIADESRYCVWCDVSDGRGYLLAKNPSWFMQNLQR